MKNVFFTWEFARSIYLRYLAQKRVVSAIPLIYQMAVAQKTAMQLIRYNINCSNTFLKYSLHNVLYSAPPWEHWGGKGADIPTLLFVKNIVGKYPEKIVENQNVSPAFQLLGWLHENHYLASSFLIEKKVEERTGRKSRTGKEEREKIALDLIHESHSAALLNFEGIFGNRTRFSADNKSQMNGLIPASGEDTRNHGRGMLNIWNRLTSLEVFTIKKTNQLFATIQSISSVTKPETSYLFTQNPDSLQSNFIRKMSSRYSPVSLLINKKIRPDITHLRNKWLIVENGLRNNLRKFNPSVIQVSLTNIFQSTLAQSGHDLPEMEQSQRKDYSVSNMLMSSRKPLTTWWSQREKKATWISLEKTFTVITKKQLKDLSSRNTIHSDRSAAFINIIKKRLPADEYFVYGIHNSHDNQDPSVLYKRTGVSEKLMMKKYHVFPLMESGFPDSQIFHHAVRNRWNTADLTPPGSVYGGVRAQNMELVYAKTPGAINDVSIKGAAPANIFQIEEKSVALPNADKKNEITVASAKPLMSREIQKIADKIYDLFERRIEREKDWKG